MKESTGEIRDYKDIPEDELKKGGWIEIPKQKLAEVQRMNRKERRRWAKMQRLSDQNQRGEKNG